MRSAADKYKREIKDSCKALWKIWVPAQLVNFAFVPRHLRIPYVAAVSFGWTVVLSTMQGRYAKQEEDAAAAGLASSFSIPVRNCFSFLALPSLAQLVKQFCNCSTWVLNSGWD